MGFEVTLTLPVDSDDDRLDYHLVSNAIRPDTAIVSVMMANNETNMLSPVDFCAGICEINNVLFHTDAVQAPGKLKIDVHHLRADFLSLSAHKLYGPKGVGLLYVKRGVKYQPYVIGGGQEQGRRGGTENVAGIVGFGRAAELAMEHLPEANSRIRDLRNKMEIGIRATIPGTMLNSALFERLPNTSNICFEGVEAEGILLMLDELGICASSGSACTSGSLDPSHVLLAMGCSTAQARGSVRFSLGIYNTEADVDFLLKHLPGIVEKLRSRSSESTQNKIGIS